jgi:hypothetical protein
VGRVLLLACSLFAILVAGAQSATDATTLVVDDDGRATPKNCNADGFAFSTIQAAVDFANPNTKIRVCPGTYAEQVVVTKDQIKLQSTRPLEAVIKAPEVMAEPGDIVTITGGARNVSLSKFTVAGPLPDAMFCSTEIRTGVKVEGGASATISDNHITEIRSASESLRGCQNGIAIAVGRDFTDQVGKAKLLRNTIDLYQKGGVFVDGPGSSANVNSNTITGNGPDPVIAQNGIQISRQAVGKVQKNDVFDNAYTGPDAGGTGILMFRPNSDSFVRANTASRNDDNIGVYETLSVVFEDNEVTASVKYDGIFVWEDSLNNRFASNTALGNFGFDCDDVSAGSGTAGTANTWVGNTGVTSNPAGICTPTEGGSDAGVHAKRTALAQIAR